VKTKPFFTSPFSFSTSEGQPRNLKIFINDNEYKISPFSMYPYNKLEDKIKNIMTLVGFQDSKSLHCALYQLVNEVQHDERERIFREINKLKC